MKPIGIIGGVGPFADIDLIQKIRAQTQACTDQEHIPIILHSYPHQIPDRSTFLLGQSPVSPSGPLLHMLESVVRAGAAVVGISCNTAHAPIIFEPLQTHAAKLGIRLLNMVDETVQFVRKYYPDIRRPGLFGTNGTYQSGIYEAAFAQADINLIKPSPDVQTAVMHPAIYHATWGIKAVCHPISRQARHLLGRGVSHLKSRTADAVLLACTELPPAIDAHLLCGLKAVDPTLALARALIQCAAGSSYLIPLATITQTQSTLIDLE